MFAQVVYLMFSSVYVCKETVEHLLLSNGGEAGHHHHYGDEDESVVGYVFINSGYIYRNLLTYVRCMHLQNRVPDRVGVRHSHLANWNFCCI
jgi:hypothetical protein